MRSSNSKGTVDGVNSESPLENGLPPKEEEDVRELAAKVVEDVVKMASAAAQQKTADQNSTPTKNRGCNLQRLPTIQIDTVQSEPSSPVDLTPPDESAEEPLDESDIQLDLDTTDQASADNSTEELKENLKSYVEDILSQAMVVAEKKLQFVGVPEDDEDEEQEEDAPAGPEELHEGEETRSSPSEPEKRENVDDPEIRATAEKVVQEVIEKASETAAQKLENGVADLSFPDLPSIQIDICKSAPPSPESEEETLPPQKKWTFTMLDDSDSEKSLQTKEPLLQPTKKALITFDEAPDDVKEVATSFVKDIVGRAVASAEEKSVPTVPFNFEDVDLMKTSGPWYVRAREALVRVLRTACFCTPRRNDS